jgi:hypothetical protein
VDAFVTQLEAKRKELGVPGAAVVVVQGDRIVRIAGVGARPRRPASALPLERALRGGGGSRRIRRERGKRARGRETPRGRAADKLYVSAASRLVLRLEMPGYLGEGLIATVIIDFSDYREVKGVRLPFVFTTPMPIIGDIVFTFDSVTLDEPLDPKMFEVTTGR